MPSSRSSSAPHARQWAASSEICEGWGQGFKGQGQVQGQWTGSVFRDRVRVGVGVRVNS